MGGREAGTRETILVRLSWRDAVYMCMFMRIYMEVRPFCRRSRRDPVKPKKSTMKIKEIGMMIRTCPRICCMNVCEF